MRIDQLLVQRGLASTRSQAQRLIADGVQWRKLEVTGEVWKRVAKNGDEVPEDAVIAGNPYTGTGLAYAFANRRVLMPHMLMYLTKDGHVVNEGLDEADAAGSWIEERPSSPTKR